MITVTLEELEHAESVLHACGLRFDGYAYAEAQVKAGGDAGAWLAQQAESFSRMMKLPAKEEHAFAALFALQRGAKSHGWFLDRGTASLAGPFLFLHLYSRPVPRRWRFESYADKWDSISAADKEAAASAIRRWLACGSGMFQP